MKKILLTAAFACALPLCAYGQNENCGFNNVIDSLISVVNSSKEIKSSEIIEAYFDFISEQPWSIDSIYFFECIKTDVKTGFRKKEALSNLGYTHNDKWLFNTKSKQIIHVYDVSDEEMKDAYESLIKRETKKWNRYNKSVGEEQVTSSPRVEPPSYAKEAVRFVGKSYAVVM